MTEWTDLEKAYLVGFRDGLKRGMTKAQQKADELADQTRNEFCAEIEAFRAEIARLRAIESAADTECDPETLLN